MNISPSPSIPECPDDDLLDFGKVAEKLGNVSVRTVRRLIAGGDLPNPVYVLSSPRLYRSDVVRFLQNLKGRRRAPRK